MKYFYFLFPLFFLSYININAQEDVITDLNRPIGLVFNGNDLYFTEANIGKISKIDITETTPNATDVVTGLGTPYTLALNGNDLYIAEIPANKISKIAVGAAAGIDDLNQLDISIYPNPTSDTVYINSSSSQLKAVVFDILGKQVLNKPNTNSVDVSSLSKGAYFIKVSDGIKSSTKRFVKN